MDIAHLIAIRPTQRRLLADWYPRVIDAAEAEGLSVAELAERIGVVRETIYAWRRRRKEQQGLEAPSSNPGGLLRVCVTEGGSSPAEARPLELRIDQRRSVLVPKHFDPATLVALVATLERC